MRKEGIPGPHQPLENGAGPLAEIIDLMDDRGRQVIQLEEVAAPHVPVRPLVSRVTGSRSSGHLESQLSLN